MVRKLEDLQNTGGQTAAEVARESESLGWKLLD